MMQETKCDQCPGVGTTVSGREYPLAATLKCRLCGATACGTEHAAKHNYQHRWPKWVKLIKKAVEPMIGKGDRVAVNATGPIGGVVIKIGRKWIHIKLDDGRVVIVEPAAVKKSIG